MRFLSKLKKPKAARMLAGALGLLLALSLVLVPATALAMPPNGHVFYGIVTSEGEPVDEGTPITIRVAGVLEYTTETIDTEGSYGFLVPADDPDTSGIEGASPNDPVEFYVNIIKASLYDVEAGNWLESYPFEIRGATELDLTVEGLEYGDAPDSPYPSLLASDGARHSSTDTEFLGLASDGEGKDFEFDANVPDSDSLDDGLVTMAITAGDLAKTVTFEVTDFTAPSYDLRVNILIDLNGDGDWNDVVGAQSEHVVQNQLISPSALEQEVVSTPFSTVGATPGPTWLRITLTRHEILNLPWDGTMAGHALMTPFECGETEDWAITIEPPETYTLTVNSDGCCPITVGALGSVAAGATETFTDIDCGTDVTLTADDSDPCCDFVEWKLDDVSQGAGVNPITVHMVSDHTAVATCSTPGPFTLTVTSDGCCPITVGALGSVAAGGSETFTGIACCTNVTLTADDSDPCCEFTAWSGDVPSGHESDNPLTIHMEADKSVTGKCTVFSTTLLAGWNLLSTPILLDVGSDSLGQIFDAESLSNIDVSFGWNGVNWVPLTSDYELSPLYAIYVKVKSGATATATFIPSEEISTPPSRVLQAGLNLIGPAPAFDLEADVFPVMPLDVALASIAEAGALTGYTMVVSPAHNQPDWAYALGAEVKDLLPYNGYWVVMENGPDTLFGFSTTPIS